MNKLGLTIIALCIGLLPAYAAGDGSTKAMRNLVVEGNRLYAEENYHGALEKYEQALALDPTYQYALYNKAVALVQLASDDNKGTANDPRKTASEIFKGIADLKTNPELAYKSFYNLGNMAYNDEKYGDAVNMYKRSLMIEPDNRPCRQNLLMAMKKQEEQEQNKDNQDQNQQDQDKQDQQQQQQQQQDQQQQQEQQQEQQPQEQQMTQNAEQLLQAMQNKENATRRKVNREPAQPGQRTTDKPW